LATGSSKRVAYAEVACNMAVAIYEFVAAAFTGGSAMISDGAHLLVDMGGGGLLLLSLTRSKRPPKEKKAMTDDKSESRDARDLTGQIGRLSEDVVKLLEEHARLFKAEIKEEASAYLRDGLILGLGGVLATVGFALLSSRLPKGAGIVYMLIGGATVLVMKNRIAKRGLIPREITEEIRRDRRWLREMI
jgi:uncharacterized membrane protein YqjE